MIEERTESNTLQDAYCDRNQAAMLAARLAWMLGYTVGWKDNEDDPDWPILFVELPTGQVSWHVPRDEAAGPMGSTLPFSYWGQWDGHTVEEKRRRISAYLEV